MLTFNAERHEYRWDGVVVPSVTQILAPLIDLSFVDPDVLQRAQAFGTAVHLACELWDKGTLDEAALDPELLPYLDGWRKFCREHSCEWTMIEQRIYHHRFKYAGTLDRLGWVDGFPSVVDIKTGTLSPSIGPQLAAYANASSPVPAVSSRVAVRLYPNGYELKKYNDPIDWAVFASLLTVRSFCEKHRIGLKEVSPSGELIYHD